MRLVKPFACAQSGWLVAQSIARASVGLPITELELATMAFVVCSLIMYILWWHKPFDVEHKTVITCPASMRTSVLEALTLEWDDPDFRRDHVPNLSGNEISGILGIPLMDSMRSKLSGGNVRSYHMRKVIVHGREQTNRDRDKKVPI